MMDKLAAASAAWKAEVGGETNLPLVWSIDEDGVLFLDGVWIAPAKYLKLDGTDDEIFVNWISIDIPVVDGSLTVIIVKRFGKHEIAGVERTVSPLKESYRNVQHSGQDSSFAVGAEKEGWS